MRFYIPWFNGLIGIYIRVSFKKWEGNESVGLSNKVDHRYCVFLDYDINEETTVHADLYGLQKQFDLGNCYLFRTKKGFHAIFLDLVTYDELKKILDASSCDDHYKYVSRNNNNRQWILRINPKKNGNNVVFDHVLPGYHSRALSFPHSNYLLAQGVEPKIINNLEPFLEGRGAKLNIVRYRS